MCERRFDGDARGDNNESDKRSMRSDGDRMVDHGRGYVVCCCGIQRRMCWMMMLMK